MPTGEPGSTEQSQKINWAPIRRAIETLTVVTAFVAGANTAEAAQTESKLVFQTRDDGTRVVRLLVAQTIGEIVTGMATADPPQLDPSFLANCSSGLEKTNPLAFYPIVDIKDPTRQTKNQTANAGQELIIPKDACPLPRATIAITPDYQYATAAPGTEFTYDSEVPPQYVPSDAETAERTGFKVGAALALLTCTAIALTKRGRRFAQTSLHLLSYISSLGANDRPDISDEIEEQKRASRAVKTRQAERAAAEEAKQEKLEMEAETARRKTFPKIYNDSRERLEKDIAAKRAGLEEAAGTNVPVFHSNRITSSPDDIIQ